MSEGASNTSQSLNLPGVAVKATFQSKVWVGGKTKEDSRKSKKVKGKQKNSQKKLYWWNILPFLYSTSDNNMWLCPFWMLCVCVEKVKDPDESISK